jgi:hypothetical protein
MPLTDFLQVNDVGTRILVTITSDGTNPTDLSSATNFTIYLYRPDSRLITGSASLFSDGTDGKIVYISQPSDLTIQGVYKIQATYQISGNLQHTNKDVFCVEPNLIGVN